jgi:hypothetical protein
MADHLNALPHEEFVSLYRAGKIRAHVDQSAAIKILATDLLPKRYIYTNAIWGWVALLCLPVAICCWIWLNWWSGFAALGIGWWSWRANNKSGAGFVLKYALEDRDFYEAIQQFDIITFSGIPSSGMELLLSQFRFAGGTGAADDPMRIEPKDRGRAMAALKGPLADMFSSELPSGVPPEAKFFLARGIVLRLLEEGFFAERYGVQGKDWRTGIQMLLDGCVEMQEVILADGTKVSFYFDFSSLDE